MQISSIKLYTNILYTQKTILTPVSSDTSESGVKKDKHGCTTTNIWFHTRIFG